MTLQLMLQHVQMLKHDKSCYGKARKSYLHHLKGRKVIAWLHKRFLWSKQFVAFAIKAGKSLGQINTSIKFRLWMSVLRIVFN